MNIIQPLTLFAFSTAVVFGQESAPVEALPGLPPEIAKVISSSVERGSEPKVPFIATDPLACAVQLAPYITGDVDKVFEFQYKICRAFMEDGRSEDALALAAKMEDYRSGLTYLDVAEQTLRKGGDRTQAIKLIKTVENQLERYKPWQQEVVRGRLYLTGELLEWQNSSLKELLDKVSDKGVLAGVHCLSMLRKQVKASSIEVKNFEAILKPIQEPTPELLVTSREIFEFVLQRLKQGNLTDTEGMIDLAVHIAESSKVQDVDLFLEYAAIYVKAGFEPQGMKLYRACKGRFGGNTEDVAKTQFLLAHLWQARSKGSEMKQLLEPFETQIRGLAKMYRPYGLAWIAAAWREIGEVTRADLCISAAAKDAETNINPRMRFLGMIDICLSYARIKRPLENSLLESMERIRDGKVTPIVE
jgi:hypothetical protein